MERDPLLHAVRAFEEASLDDAEYALTLINGVMKRKRAQFVRDLDGKQPVAAVPTIPDRLADVLLESGKANDEHRSGGHDR